MTIIVLLLVLIILFLIAQALRSNLGERWFGFVCLVVGVLAVILFLFKIGALTSWRRLAG